MTKLIVLSLTATAAVSAPGTQKLRLTGFSPLTVDVFPANENASIVRRLIWLGRPPL